MVLPLGAFSQNATDLFFSEYIEGSSNNKYLEIFNGTGSNVDLSDYQVLLFANGATDPNNTENLTGTLASGSVIVLKNSSATLYSETTITSSTTNFNGNDAIAIKKVSTDSYVDIIGRIGESEYWTSGDLSTQNKTLVRKSYVASGVTTNPASGFPTLETEWDVFPIDNVEDLGKHTFSPSTPGTLSDLTIPGTAFSTGEEVTITWSATDVTTIKFQVRDEPGTEWYDLEGLESIDATWGTITFNIPTYATEGANVLRIVDTSNPSVFAESVVFTLTDVHFAGLFPGMGLFPADEAVAIPIDLFGIIDVEDEDPFVSMHQLLINFYEDVKAGTGNIRLYKTQGDELVATYDITGSSIQFWGSAVAITVDGNLDPNTQYYVTIDNGAITDQASTPNVFDGNITWSFTTGANDSFETIPEIRGTEDEPALMGETVITSGVVSHKLGTNRFWIQDDNSGYNGILVYDLAATGNVNIGDMITLVGTVGHYQNIAQLTNILDIQIISSGNAVEPTLITLPFDERWESMLVKVEDVHYTDAAISFGEFEVSDGINTGLIDDWMYEHTPTAAEQFESITGILNYSYSFFKIAPRWASDIVSGAVGVNDPEAAELLIAPNPVSDRLYITAPEALTAVQIINTAGSVVKDILVDTDLQVTLPVDDLPRGLYLVRLTTVSGKTLISKVIKQ
jgi:hypothetical protein